MFDNWDAKDTGLAMQGFGSLASAWGSYETDKQRNKLLKEQLDYEKSKDALANERLNMAQSELDDAFMDSDLFGKKKKKTTDSTVDTEQTV
jgi:hypothetical protein